MGGKHWEKTVKKTVGKNSGKLKSKKGTGLFDVTMGCYDGAEICQLVGTFVLATIAKAMPTASIGLGVLWDTPGSKADRIRKDLIKMFAEMGLNDYDSN